MINVKLCAKETYCWEEELRERMMAYWCSVSCLGESLYDVYSYTFTS